MKTPKNNLLYLAGLFGVLCAPAFATVQIGSMTPSPAGPQLIGTSITWTVSATDTGSGPLTFQFSVAHPGAGFNVARDFNVGTFAGGTWTSQRFVWTPTGVEGTYQIQVIAKDFSTGQSATQVATFQVNPLVTGTTPVIAKTANPLVALFSAPPCALGSTIRVHFQKTRSTFSSVTPWIPCRAPNTMSLEIAGLRPNSVYAMFAQVQTNGKVVNGQTVDFTTGQIPGTVPIPNFKVLVPAGSSTDRTDSIILHNPTQLGGGTNYPDVATDLAGNVLWYYYPIDISHSDLLTRPLPNGTFLTIENGPSWNPTSQQAQLLHQIDLAGNIVKETNAGIIQQQLLALGAVNAHPCNGTSSPAPVGFGCLGSFHHDFIQSLPNGGSAVIADIEKIFPAGTQGDTSGLPVDVIGDMIVVLDNNWQVKWYFDTFEHAGGAPQLDINRRAVLGETCVSGQGGCPPVFLLGNGIAPKAMDWLHANSLYYWPAPQDGNTVGGDIIWSSRHQDWVMKVDYKDGAGTGNILWRMGPGGDFKINSTDPWPWFSHQHEVGIESNGKMTIFDNGNTRLSPPTGTGSSTGGTPGLGSNCGPNDCHSRGMAVEFSEATMTVTPVLSADLGYYSIALGSAQLLSDGNYFFLAGIVVQNIKNAYSYCLEMQPKTGSTEGTSVLNLQGTESYRGWQMPTMYGAPTT